VPVFVTGLLLLLNNVTLYFLLSPHTSLLNLLAPLVCLWVAHRAWHDGLFWHRRVWTGALATGLGFASYGSFLLALPALRLPAAARDLVGGRSLGMAFLVRLTEVAACSVAPIAAWYAIVVAHNGAFYSAEVEDYHMFVWMVELARWRGWPFVAAKLGLVATLGLRSAALMSVPALAVMATAFLAMPRPRRELWRRVKTDAALAGGLFGLFFVLCGVLFDRNVYSATVPLIALAGACVAQAEELHPGTRVRLSRWTLAATALAYAAFVLLKDVGRPTFLG
jgi:hypothetical protein